MFAIVISSPAVAAGFDLPMPTKPLAPTLMLWATHYYVHAASATAGGVPLRDAENQILSAPISPRAWCLGAIEGTIAITDAQGKSTTYNYCDSNGARQVDCRAVLALDTPWIDATGRSRFGLARGPYGDGVRNFELVPYRTVAVDPKVIPFGSVLYVPAVRGRSIRLPDGQTVLHDGYFFAGDAGGAIQGNHIDVFSGIYEGNPFPGVIRSASNKTFEAFIVRDPNVVTALARLHRSSAEWPP